MEDGSFSGSWIKGGELGFGGVFLEVWERFFMFFIKNFFEQRRTGINSGIIFGEILEEILKIFFMLGLVGFSR